MNKNNIIKYKTCTKCKITKTLIKFSRDKNRKDGMSCHCKNCCKLQQDKYCQLHKKEKEIYNKNYYQSNKKKICIHQKKYNVFHTNKIKKYQQQYRNTHKNKRRIYDQINKNNKNLYLKKRRKIDINFKITCNLRCRIWYALKNNSKSKSTMKLIGCSVEKLKQHLKKKFTKRMNWNNYGRKGWHVDHIRPCCSFDLSKPREQCKCFHYSNLQPLWAEDNRKKESKYKRSKDEN